MKGISWVVAAALATVLGGCARLKARPDVPRAADEGYVVRSVSCAASIIGLIIIFASGTRSQPWLLEHDPFHARLATPAPGAPRAEMLAERFRSCTPACDSILTVPLFIR